MDRPSLSLTLPRQSPTDPPPALARLREEDPVTPVRCPRGIDAWLVTRHADVRTVLADAEGFSSVDAPFGHLYDDWELGSEPGPGDLLRFDGARHSRLRKRLTAEFTARRTKAMRAQVGRIVDDTLTALAAATPPGTPADLNAAFAEPIPLLAMAELLGVPEADRFGFGGAFKLANDLSLGPEEHRRGHATVRAYMAGRLAAEQAEPGDTLIGRLVAANDGPDPLSDEELVVVAEMLLLAGAETTANMISLGVLVLLQHPEQWELLRREPERVPAAVEELLRYLSIIQYGVLRRATTDTELAGRAISRGDYVVPSIPAANRDPEVLDGAERFDVARPRASHLAFGHGPHQCIGQNLARLELELALTALLSRVEGLELACAVEDVPVKHEMSVYGVHCLPVSWEVVTS